MRFHGTGAFLVGVCTAWAAVAEHPGEMWSVDRLDISGPGAAEVRGALKAANEIYFYGDRSVRMEVQVGANALRMTVRDAASGAVLVDGARLPLGSDGAAIQQAALDWMDTLECASINCDGAESPTMLASAPAEVPTQVVGRAAPAKAVWPSKVTGLLEQAAGTGAMPIPKPRPGAEPSGLAGLRSVQFARTPDEQLKGLAAPIRWSCYRPVCQD